MQQSTFLPEGSQRAHTPVNGQNLPGNPGTVVRE